MCVQTRGVYAMSVLLPYWVLACLSRRALGVFVLWVFLIHVACFIFHKIRGKQSNVLQLGLNCLLLTTNNTGCIGWPVLIATVGQQSAVLSMLLGKCFFDSSCSWRLAPSHPVHQAAPEYIVKAVCYSCITRWVVCHLAHG